MSYAEGKPFERLCGVIADALPIMGAEKTLIIQPHDNPDHDAVAAAFALTKLLERRGFSPRIVHRGTIRSHSLQAMTAELSIPLELCDSQRAAEQETIPCVVIDASPNNTNATPLTDRLVAVVDHHPHPGDLSGLPFSDIRPQYGSCASIVAEYWQESGEEVDKATATALLMGIQMDTDFLSRRVSQADLEAHYRLFFRGDWEFGARIVKSALAIQDLPALKEVLGHARVRDGIFFSVVPFECTQEVLSIMADFFLRIKEARATVIVEAGGGEYHVSARSKLSSLSASELMKRALVGIGRGGGHDHMAGGIIDPALYPGEPALFERFVAAATDIQE